MFTVVFVFFFNLLILYLQIISFEKEKQTNNSAIQLIDESQNIREADELFEEKKNESSNFVTAEEKSNELIEKINKLELSAQIYEEKINKQNEKLKELFVGLIFMKNKTFYFWRIFDFFFFFF